MILVLSQRYGFFDIQSKTIPENPKRTGGGGRTGEARKDEGQLVPLDSVS